MQRQWKPFILTLVAAVAMVAPFAAADADSVCIPSCSIGATQVPGYLTPATVVTSGSMVTWTSLDNIYHTATSADFALDARIFSDDANEPPAEAAFEIREDGLWVFDPVDERWRRSTSATGTPEGGFVLEYTCLFHSKFQQGALVVVPSAT